MLKVALVMGSDSDLPVVEKAIKMLKDFSIPYEASIMSAHRTPEAAADFAKNALDNGFGVIIAFAGMAAHLAGAIAANTVLPVIGVPCSGGAADGLDALLSTVQMPPGVPVATVGLDAGANAAILAAQILSLSQPELINKLNLHKKQMADAVAEKNAKLAEKLNN